MSTDRKTEIEAELIAMMRKGADLLIEYRRLGGDIESTNHAFAAVIEEIERKLDEAGFA